MIAADERISVVIPVFNGERFLAEAVASIVTHRIAPTQIVIVDDGSTDGTPEIVAGLGGTITSVRQTNRGPAAARNRGIELADSDLVAFLDADDLWGAGHPTAALGRLREAGDLDMVIGRTQCLRYEGDVGGRACFRPWREPFHSVNVGSWLCRRDLFGRVGLFDETLTYGEDLDWFLRAREAGARIGRIDGVCLLYRLRPGGMVARRGAGRGGLLDALRRSISRRRVSRGMAGEGAAPPRALPSGAGE